MVDNNDLINYMKTKMQSVAVLFFLGQTKY